MLRSRLQQLDDRRRERPAPDGAGRDAIHAAGGLGSAQSPVPGQLRQERPGGERRPARQAGGRVFQTAGPPRGTEDEGQPRARPLTPSQSPSGLLETPRPGLTSGLGVWALPIADFRMSRRPAAGLGFIYQQYVYI